MQHNIDTYFKEKLLHREFELKDAYWQEAEAILDAAKKKKRRGFLLWWLGGAATVAALTLFLMPNNNSTLILADQSQIVEKELVNAFPEKSNLAEGNIAIDEPVRKHNTENSSIKNNDGGRAIAASKGLAQNLLATSAEFSENDFVEQPKIPNETNTTEVDLMPQESLTEKLSTRQAAPDLLAPLLAFVNGDFTAKPQTKNTCYEPSPFHFGVSAAQLMQVVPTNGESLVTAVHGGVVFQYDLNKNWYVSSGVGYLRRDGHFEASKITEMRNYRFGLELMENLLRPTSLHYLEMPLSVGWKKGHNLFEGGICIDYLTGVRGEIGKLEKVDIERPTKEFVSYKKAWIAEDGFTRWNVSPMVGYRYRVNKELSFGLTAQYNLRPLTDKKPVLGDYILQEDDRFNVRLQAVYLLK